MGKNSDLPDIRVNDPRGVIIDSGIRPGSAAGGAPKMDIPKRDRRGRPKGSKNKPRVEVVAHTRDFPVVPVNPTETTGVAGSAIRPAVVNTPVVTSPPPVELAVLSPVVNTGSPTSSTVTKGAAVEDAIETAADAGEFKPAGVETVVPVVVAKPVISWMDGPPNESPTTESSFVAWRLS